MISYDAVVAGAGLGGLSAALRLTLQGKKTLLLEQRSLPGGAASSFRRGRFEFDPCLRGLTDIGTDNDPGALAKLLSEYGVKLPFCTADGAFRLISRREDGTPLDLVLPAGIGDFIDLCEALEPGSAPKMEAFFRLLEEVNRGCRALEAAGGAMTQEMLQEIYPALVSTGAYTVTEVFHALKLPQGCRELLSAWWSDLCVPVDRLSFPQYASYVYRILRRGVSLPVQGSSALSTALADRFRKLGGTLRLGEEVTGLLFDGDKLTGVRTALNDYAAEQVFLDIHPDRVCGRLLPWDRVPQEEKQLSAARGGDYAGCFFTLCLGLDRDARELGIRDHRIIISPSTDPTAVYDALMEDSVSAGFLDFTCAALVDPEAAPKGGCVCALRTLTSPAQWEGLSQEEYQTRKNGLSLKLLQLLADKAGIHLLGHIEELTAMTPLSYARILGTPQGAGYGCPPQDWDGYMARLRSSFPESGIPGLHYVGASAALGGGMTEVMLGGSVAAKLAQNRSFSGRKEERR